MRNGGIILESTINVITRFLSLKDSRLYHRQEDISDLHINGDQDDNNKDPKALD
ncbi:Uncharacterised protein [Chlamydia abortus]|nr:Uncharacterised protein [Chlamydia abortus]